LAGTWEYIFNYTSLSRQNLNETTLRFSLSVRLLKTLQLYLFNILHFCLSISLINNLLHSLLMDRIILRTVCEDSDIKTMLQLYDNRLLIVKTKLNTGVNSNVE